MPLQILALPVDFPRAKFLDVGCFGKRMFEYLAPIVPKRVNFEQLQALIRNSESNIKLGSNVQGGRCDST